MLETETNSIRYQLGRLISSWGDRNVHHCCCPCSVTQSCPTLYDPIHFSTPGFHVLHHLLQIAKLMSIESMMPPNHCIFCHPLLLLPSTFPRIRVFSNKSGLTSCGQSIGASASASVLLMNIQCCFPLGLTGSIPCCSRDSQVSSPTPQFESTNSLTWTKAPILGP